MLWSDLVVSLSSKTWPVSRDVSKKACGVCGYARKNSHKWAPATSQRDFNLPSKRVRERCPRQNTVAVLCFQKFTNFGFYVIGPHKIEG